MNYIRYLLIPMLVLPFCGRVQTARESSGGTPVMIAYEDFQQSYTGIENGVKFDFYGNDTVERMSWTKANARVGFLVLPNDKGQVLSAKHQMFSNVTPQDPTINAKLGGLDTPHKGNGFNALARYDSNGDGFITPADPVFSKLRVWFNYSHDGVYDPITKSGEIKTLPDLGIISIDIDNYTEVDLIDGHGNRILWLSNIDVAPGYEQPSVYDVQFAFTRKNLSNYNEVHR